MSEFQTSVSPNWGHPKPDDVFPLMSSFKILHAFDVLTVQINTYYIIYKLYIYIYDMYKYSIYFQIWKENLDNAPFLFHVPETVLWHLRREILRVRGVALELITEVHRWRGMIWYCWWFRNLANQLRLVIFSHYLRGFWDHPRWLFGISEPSAVWNTEIYEIILKILKHRQEYYRQHIIFICDL